MATSDSPALERLLSVESLTGLAEQGLINHVERDAAGNALRSVTAALIEAPVETVWAAVEDVRTAGGGFMGQMPMMRRFQVLEEHGERAIVRLDLRYRFFVLGFNFHVVAERTLLGERTVRVRAQSGSIPGFEMWLRVLPSTPAGRALLFCATSYQVRSLGWLVDHFLKHHPEIELGIFSSTSEVIALALKEYVEKRPGRAG